MAAIAMGGQRGGIGKLILAGFILLLIGGLIFFFHTPAQTDLKHPEAPQIRRDIFDGKCKNLLVFFSPIRGNLLFLCEMPELGPDVWGGLFYKVAEWLGGSGYKFVPENQVREVTAFASTYTGHWAEEIINYQYYEIARYPDVWNYFSKVMGW